MFVPYKDKIHALVILLVFARVLVVFRVRHRVYNPCACVLERNEMKRSCLGGSGACVNAPDKLTLRRL